MAWHSQDAFLPLQERIFESSTNNLAPISSGPGDLFAFKFFNAISILHSLIVNSSIVELVFTLGVVGISSGSLVVNTLAK